MASLVETDETQRQLMKELCIVVNEKDEVIGSDTKENCHLMSKIKEGLLHRAFSVFLFNSEGKLLLQQRAAAKITFPSYWTNTCCSHPLYYLQADAQETYQITHNDELEETNQLGVKRAAQRKLLHELGINPEEVPLDSFTFLTRIHYLAPSDDQWGEHEVDYVLAVQKDVKVNPNENEVSEVKYVSQEELSELVKTAEEKGVKLTPWFRLINDTFLRDWWSSLNNLSSKTDHKIHKL